MSDEELTHWATKLDVPTSGELDGSEPLDDPPDGFATWDEWRRHRWPPSVHTPGMHTLGMVETVMGGADTEGVAAAAQLLHDFNVEYDEPAPPPHVLAARLAELIAGDHITVLLARERETATALGVAVIRLQPSVWSAAQEAYLAELYVVADRRGQGYGRELITEVLRVARERGADYAFIVTSEADRAAQRLYEAADFRRTEGDGGPAMIAYEREL